MPTSPIWKKFITKVMLPRKESCNANIAYMEKIYYEGDVAAKGIL